MQKHDVKIHGKPMEVCRASQIFKIAFITTIGVIILFPLFLIARHGSIDLTGFLVIAIMALVFSAITVLLWIKPRRESKNTNNVLSDGYVTTGSIMRTKYNVDAAFAKFASDKIIGQTLYYEFNDGQGIRKGKGMIPMKEHKWILAKEGGVPYCDIGDEIFVVFNESHSRILYAELKMPQLDNEEID